MEHEPAHVLLIEDNPGDADLVRLRLVESKPDVFVNCVPRLSDALACLDAETPSLVLLDLNLPDSHGAETFRRIMQKAQVDRKSTRELQSHLNLVCRLLLEKKKEDK